MTGYALSRGFIGPFAGGVRPKAQDLEEVDAEKPEGKLLQQIMQENDPAKKSSVDGAVHAQFPKAEQTRGCWSSCRRYYVKANQPDQIIAAGDKLLALDPEDPEAALQCLKAAEAKKDAALIKKYAVATSTNARKMAASPQPKEADAGECLEADRGLREAGG